jgi:hypothetical protein
MMGKWVIFDGEEIIGRVHSKLNSRDMAFLYARTIFPDVAGLRLKDWSNASKKERAAAKDRQLVRAEMCTRLWPNPPKGRLKEL